jgi:hypothetical protein
MFVFRLHGRTRKILNRILAVIPCSQFSPMFHKHVAYMVPSFPNYYNFSKISKDLLASFLLCFYLCFLSTRNHSYPSRLTYRQTYLLVMNKALILRLAKLTFPSTKSISVEKMDDIFYSSSTLPGFFETS